MHSKALSAKERGMQEEGGRRDGKTWRENPRLVTPQDQICV